MFAFDNQLFTLRRLKLKAISQSTIDPRVTFVDETDRTIKMPIPVSIARRMKQLMQGTTRFVTYYPCDIAFMGDRIVSMSVPNGPEYHTYKETGKWTSKLSFNCQMVKVLDKSWHYDGQYVYRVLGKVSGIPNSGFGSQEVEVLNLYRLDETRDLASMASLAYLNPKNQQWVVTCPVTRSSGELLQLTGDVDVFNGGDHFGATSTDLMLMDVSRYPNLRFVNYAARALSNNFGFEAIEPLGLPILMIEHRTFNIGGLPTNVQATSPAPFKFTYALAWLIGMFGQVQSLEQMIALKSSIKMLLTKGNTPHRMSNKDGAEHDTKKQIATVRQIFAGAELIKF